MERVANVLLVLTVALMVFASKGGEGARTLRSNEIKADGGDLQQPQTFFGGIGRSFPTPGFTGTFPSPGLSFPSPGLSFPSPGFSGSFPSPGFRFGPPGPGSLCSFFPGSVSCAPPAQSKGPRGSGGGGRSGSP